MSSRSKKKYNERMKIEMSKQEARKITSIEELLAGHLTNQQASELLDLSVRQIQRLKSEATANGVMSLLHKNRGRKPANINTYMRCSRLMRFKVYQIACLEGGWSHCPTH